MKLKNLFTVLGLSAVAAGAGLAVANSDKQARVAKAESSSIYFNVSEYGPTYGDQGEFNTKFGVWACGAGEVAADAWFESAPVSGYPSIRKITCDAAYTQYVVCRFAADAEMSWETETKWNQTCDIYEGEEGYNYFWIWSEGKGQFGNKYTPHKIVDTKLHFASGSADYSMYYNYNNLEYAITNKDLDPSLKFVVVSNGVTYGYSDLEDNSLFNEEEGNYISVKNASLFAIYLKPNGKLWAQIDSYEEASNWAKDFVENVGCVSPYNAKPANWDAYAASFATLTDGGKDTLIGAVASNAGTASYIQQAAFIHDLCVAKYEGCSVFMMREGGGSRAIEIVKTSLPTNVENDSTIAIVAIVAGVSVIALSALLILKKRKHN